MDDARFATAFDNASREYERGRPGYPSEAIEALERSLDLGERSVVVDLGAGTGKLTRDLVKRFSRVIAVEPLPEMRDRLRRLVPTAEVTNGTAEQLPLSDRLADAVLVAQAFHWFDGPRALDEIARVLRPGGGLGLLWNTTPWERRESPWFELLDDLLEGRRVDLSVMRRHSSGQWRIAFESDERFQPLSEATFDNTLLMSRDEFLANLASRSYVAVLSPRERRNLLSEVARLLDRPDAPSEADRVVVPMRTAVYWAQLEPPGA